MTHPAAATPEVPSLVVIYRGVAPRDVVTATGHLLHAGFLAFEVSLTTSDAVDSISLLAREYGEDALIGAGTVRTLDDVDRVRDAGARMMLSPVTSPPVIAAAAASGMVTIPGALSPTEVATADEAGAHLVKLFPAATAGLDYFRLLREPFPDVSFLVTGGLDAKLAGKFLGAGASTVGVGHSLLGGPHLAERDWSRFTSSALQYRDTALETSSTTTSPTTPSTSTRSQA